MLDEATFAIGAILIFVGLALFRRTRTFISECRTTTGHITGYTKEDSDEGPPFYFSVIRFRDTSGVEREIRGPHGLQEPPTVGTEVSITYDATYPTNAWITGTPGPWVIPWLVLIVGVAVVIAGFVVRA
ncbi:MAG: DUF3592 domain-containing protein, partial [Thermoanaerobaculia bacterium]